MNHDHPKRRPPAFLLYADDFLSGTLDMSQEEVGAYIRLLCWQWNRGSIPVATAVQQRLAGGSVSVAVLAKFTKCEDGELRNLRMEAVRADRIAFHEKQAEKGRKSANARNRGSTTVPTTVQPRHQPEGQPDTQPESNLPIPSPIPSDTPLTPQGGKRARARSQFVPPTREELNIEAKRLGMTRDQVDAFVGYYGSNGWKVGRNPMKSWQHALSGWAARNREKNGHTTNPAGVPKPHRNDNVMGADRVAQRIAEDSAHWARFDDPDGPTPFD